MTNTRQILKDGFWNNNPALVQLLGLCPLLAVTSTFINGLGLGIATTVVIIGSNVLVSLVRNLVSNEIRIPVYVLIIAALVTAVEMSLNAWFHPLYKTLGIFIPLIVTNCAIIGRAEAFASKHHPWHAFIDGLAMGLGFTIILVLLGALREIIGMGTLFANAHLMFGEAARNMSLSFSDDYPGFLLAVLPPGAFIGLGLLIAIKNIIDRRQAQAVTNDITVSADISKA